MLQMQSKGNRRYQVGPSLDPTMKCGNDHASHTLGPQFHTLYVNSNTYLGTGQENTFVEPSR